MGTELLNYCFKIYNIIKAVIRTFSQLCTITKHHPNILLYQSMYNTPLFPIHETTKREKQNVQNVLFSITEWRGKLKVHIISHKYFSYSFFSFCFWSNFIVYIYICNKICRFFYSSAKNLTSMGDSS